ncbi:MAG: protein TolR [Ostreibacterium sp.]
MGRKRRGQRVKSEMNVVPYIDVMLVLLVIFMISAPLLNQSVNVDLPHSKNAKDINTNTPANTPEPLVVSINHAGAYFIDRADDNALPVSTRLITQLTQEALAENPKTPIYIRADKAIDYGAVMMVMDILKDSGAEAVGLITETKEQ